MCEETDVRREDEKYPGSRTHSLSVINTHRKCASASVTTHAQTPHLNTTGSFFDSVQLFMKTVYTCNKFNLPLGRFGLFKNCLQQAVSVRPCVLMCAYVNEYAAMSLQWKQSTECSSESSPLSFQGEPHFSIVD